MKNETYRQDGKPNVVIIRRKKALLARRKRLLTLVLMLLFTGVMLGTSTYAWFTSNKTVTVQDIVVNVSTSTGLLISADGITFKSTLSNADILNAHSTYGTSVNQIPSNLGSISPVSTVGTVDTTGKMEMYLGNLDAHDGTNYTCDENTGGFCLTASKTTETEGTTGNFIVFDIFLKLGGTGTGATPLYLNLESSRVDANGNDNGIKNASRIGFVIEGNTTENAQTSAIQGLTLNGATHSNTSSENASVFIWEPNYNTHTEKAKDNALAWYVQGANSQGANDTDYGTSYTISSSTFDSETFASSAPILYYGIKAPILQANSQSRNSGNAEYFAVVTPDYTTTTGQTGQLPVFGIQTGITKVRVYMWVEGQDIDCEDAASGGVIKYNLQFTVEAA